MSASSHELARQSAGVQQSRSLTVLPPKLSDITTLLGLHCVLDYYLLLQLTPTQLGEKSLCSLHVLITGDH